MKFLDWVGTAVRTFVLAALLPGSLAAPGWAAETARPQEPVEAAADAEGEDREQRPVAGEAEADSPQGHALHDYLVHWRVTRR